MSSTAWSRAGWPRTSERRAPPGGGGACEFSAGRSGLTSRPMRPATPSGGASALGRTTLAERHGAHLRSGISNEYRSRRRAQGQGIVEVAAVVVIVAIKIVNIGTYIIVYLARVCFHTLFDSSHEKKKGRHWSARVLESCSAKLLETCLSQRNVRRRRYTLFLPVRIQVTSPRTAHI